MKPSSAISGKRSQAVADQTREAMLEAALRAFADHGFEATSLRQAADLAGVSHGLFRKHFGNKEALWRAAVDFGVNRYSQAMKQRATSEHGPVSTVQDLVRVMLAVTAEHPELVRLMVTEGAVRSDRSDYIAEIWHDVGDHYRDLFYSVQKEGELTAFVDSDMFLFVLTAGMIPLALPGLTGSILGVDISTERERDAHTERLIDVLFR